jgi:hypothetical protein
MSSDRAGERVLHVYWSLFEPVAHVVSAETMARAAAADAAPVIVDFGDLRRSGDTVELERQLDQVCQATLEEYVGAIERSDGRESHGGDIRERLAALDEVVFEGLPADQCDHSEGCDFLPADDDALPVDDHEPAPEYRGYDIIAKAMSGDIPTDIFDEYCTSVDGDSPLFSGHIDDRVEADKLPALIAALEARGYTVIED